AKRLLISCTVSYPDLFALIDFTKLKPVLEKKIFQIVNTGENESSKSPGILVLRINRWNPSDVPFDELVAVGILYVYELIKDSFATQRNGGILIIDADGFEFSHVKVISFDAIKRLNCLLNALPIKFVGCVIINSPKVVEKLFNIFKYAVGAKNRKLIHVVHKNLWPLNDMIPAADSMQIPRCFGGKVDDEIGFLSGVEDYMMDDTTVPTLVANVQNKYKMQHINV
ncbi:Alpha-tocopherol transfer protein, partial [Folsomia candida]